MLLDYLFETAVRGGWILVPIFGVGAVGFFLVGEVVWTLGIRRRGSLEGFFSRVESGEWDDALKSLAGRPGLTGYALALATRNRHRPEGDLRRLLDERLSGRLAQLGRRIPMISVLASVAPLLGLLGTVTGMVHTFEVITIYGNSNPFLLAGGISEALLTTQSGLLIAFPLLLAHHQLQDRFNWRVHRLELAVVRFLNLNYRYDRSGATAPGGGGGQAGAGPHTGPSGPVSR